MSRLSLAQQASVVRHLVEGASVASTVRLAEISKPTVLSLNLRMGSGCDRVHDRFVRDVDVREIEGDEIWSFVQKKQARVQPGDPPSWGDAYTFVAMARTCKLILAYRVGKRDEENARAFIADLRSRLVTVPLLATDGFQPYPAAVAEHFQGAVDFAVLHKDYRKGRRPDGQPSDHRYEPPRDPFITKRTIYGTPDLRRASTSHVERQNLTMRMQIRRLTRLCNGFSKKLEQLRAAISLHFAYFNFCRVHEALRVTPAMEAGITDHVWSVEELVAVALSEPAGDPPRAKPLRLAEQSAPARELPNGRGWLRLVHRAGGAPAAPVPVPATPPVQAPGASSSPGDERPRQEPRPWRPMEQLDLFP